MDKKLIFCLSLVALGTMWGCGCGNGRPEEENPDFIDNDNAFSAEALADIVEYQRQKEGEGTEYNPWSSYGLTELVDFSESEDQDYEYADEDGEDVYDELDDEYRQIPDADEEYAADPVVYFLGHNVEFNADRHDVSAFTGKDDDAVGVIDRFDDEGSKIDILVYSKDLYNDFIKKSKDPVRYTPKGGDRYLSKGDSLDRSVYVCFEGRVGGGWLISIVTEK